MKEIEEAINNIKAFEDSLMGKNTCLEVFHKTLSQGDVSQDVYYSARAFTSIINQIVNKKIEYAHYVIKCQTEMLDFLNTYDDKYLSRLSNTISTNTNSEFFFVDCLISEINDLIDFLKNILQELFEEKSEEDLNDWELPKDLQEKLDNVLEEFIKKYGGLNYEE